jgi:hypothetical protein
MIKKVVYLVGSPFSERDFNRFGIAILIKEGYDVEVWDYSSFLQPALIGIVTPLDFNQFSNLKKFTSKVQAITALSELGKNVFIISILSYNSMTIGIFKAISKNSIPYSVLGHFFSIFENEEIKTNKMKKLISITPKKIMRQLRYLPARLPYAIFGIKSATYVFMGGSLTKITVPMVDEETKKVHIHSFDYDLYLKESNDGPSANESIVFLDQNIPFNTDPLPLGDKRLTTSQEYFPSLCKFFDKIEAKTGEKVVIAAHPRSYYEDKTYLFQGRKIVRGNTSQLVKDSKFVITHYTTAINMAVLYNKPILFITTNAIEKSFRQKAIDTLADYFNQRVINIDRKTDTDVEKDIMVNEQIYNQFKNDFIKILGTPELPFWKVVSNHIYSLAS